MGKEKSDKKYYSIVAFEKEFFPNKAKEEYEKKRNKGDSSGTGFVPEIINEIKQEFKLI
ncbi:MAG: hypothetical protein GYA60_09595 [Candidatus Methanofastidiosa archaeon]|nr:hypothetical protein [Candidatus Methanofastidiosa archaeon]